jgi:hypothetical protein
MPSKGSRDQVLNTLMKTYCTTETTLESGRSETNQMLNEPQRAKLGDRRVVIRALAGYSWRVQSGRSSVRGCDESDFMKSQLG